MISKKIVYTRLAMWFLIHSELCMWYLSKDLESLTRAIQAGKYRVLNMQ